MTTRSERRRVAAQVGPVPGDGRRRIRGVEVHMIVRQGLRAEPDDHRRREKAGEHSSGHDIPSLPVCTPILT